MTVETLLNQLSKVRQNGTNKWMACCPAHEDRSPSLSIREPEIGMILIHCFAGCEVPDILGSVGLQMTDLFPKTDSLSYQYDQSLPPVGARKSALLQELRLLEDGIGIYHAMIKAGGKFDNQGNKKRMDDFMRIKQIKKQLGI